MKPKVSVIMSVYNSEDYVRAAVESVLNQDYRDFELLIVDDGSTDSSVRILKRYRDERIILIENPVNLGFANSLNKAVRQARGTYIARMDSDDIALPNYLQDTVAYLDGHPDTGVVYGDMIKFHGHQLKHEWDTNDYTSDFIHAILLFYNVVNHNCVVMKREIFDTYAYDPEFSVSEDAKLWTQISAEYPIERLPQTVVLYRVHEKQVSVAKRDLQRQQELKRMTPWLGELLGEVSEEELSLHDHIAGKQPPVDFAQALRWLHRLGDANERVKLFEKRCFHQVLLRMFITTAAYNHYTALQKFRGAMSFGVAESVRFALRMCKNMASDAFYFAKAKQLLRQRHINYF